MMPLQFDRRLFREKNEPGLAQREGVRRHRGKLGQRERFLGDHVGQNRGVDLADPQVHRVRRQDGPATAQVHAVVVLLGVPGEEVAELHEDASHAHCSRPGQTRYSTGH